LASTAFMAVGACRRAGAKSKKHGANRWTRSTPRAATCNSATNAPKSTMGINARTLSDIDSEGTKLAESDELNAVSLCILWRSPLNFVFCSVDQEDTCNRAICECDRRLAMQLAKLEDTASYDYHSKYGTFNFQEQCVPQCTGTNCPRWDQCCGDYPARFPYNSDDGAKKCCGQKTYYKSVLSCCQGDRLQPYGTCSYGGKWKLHIVNLECILYNKIYVNVFGHK